MEIRLSPQRCNRALSVTKSGDVFTLNGDAFDFSSLPDGATIPGGEIPCDWIVGPVERVGGELRLTLVLPHGPNPSVGVAFPAPIIDPPDGMITLPADPAPVEQAIEEEPANVDG
ncbi:hypothetical protein CN934_03335 [Ensifer sp. MMN_5]|nr:hypothetical protein CN934_03335 [Ensifer sp. MMN_5]